MTPYTIILQLYRLNNLHVKHQSRLTFFQSFLFRPRYVIFSISLSFSKVEDSNWREAADQDSDDDDDDAVDADKVQALDDS
jgi:hypothetical protein